jgi:hypothetical protein
MSDSNRLTDLAERLRDKAFKRCGPTMEAVHTKTDEWKAADAIDALMAALKPFDEMLQRDFSIMSDDGRYNDDFTAKVLMRLGDLRAARAALGEKK